MRARHRYHRWKPPVWIDRTWWYDLWDERIRWKTFTGCTRYDRHPTWRLA